MKKTGMAKSTAKKLMGKMLAPGAPGFGHVDVATVNRREQRKLDQALGLVPFATKLHSELVQPLEAGAKARDLDIGDFITEILIKGLSA